MPLLLITLTALALVLRLWGLADPSLSHPEIYVPGIALPEGISEPPPRTDLGFAVWWHFHDEPHPMGWYLAMFGWTSLAGTSEIALRLPGAILGAATVPLAFLLGRGVFSSAVGLLAAALLAFHGFHLFWSQNARMYVAGAFLGLLATDLLLRLAAERRARPGLETAYVATCLAGIQTVEFFWPLLLMQAAWVSLCVARPVASVPGIAFRPHRAGPRLLQLQALTLAIGAPALLHAAYRGRGGAVEDPSLGFIADYLQFGFLMVFDDFPVPFLEPLPPLYWALLVICVGLVLLSTRARSAPLRVPRDKSPGNLPFWLLPAVAVVTSAFMLWLASLTMRRTLPLMVLSVLPILALLVPAIGAFVRVMVARIGPLERALSRVPPGVLLLWLLGVVSPVLLWFASFVVSVAAERAFLIFVPYLLALAAAGALAMPGGATVRGAVLAGLAAIFAGTLLYNAGRVTSPRDYKGLAAKMQPLLEPGDLVFLRHEHWADTPFFYYLPDARYVTQDYGTVLEENPTARVWLVTWPEIGTTFDDERRAALAEYLPTETLAARRASAELFRPPEP